MKPSEIKKLQRGDKVWWSDPEDLCSRFYTVRRAGLRGLLATIEDMNGFRIECPVQQLSRESPKSFEKGRGRIP